MIKVELTPSEIALLINVLEMRIRHHVNNGNAFKVPNEQKIHRKLTEAEVRYYRDCAKNVSPLRNGIPVETEAE